jgi:manganese/zinc/iron transport system ATP- binding protein
MTNANTLSQIDHPVLRTTQLSVLYDQTAALWDINLTVPSGKLVGIIGPNGSGKTTFIKSALGLISPIKGKIEFFGLPLKKVRRRIAYVPQRQSVDWDFPITVKELVLMGHYGRLGLLRWHTRQDFEEAQKYLEMVDLAKYADRQIGQLSGGQQQRAFIARALMQEPDIYFMDEPFAGIDATSEKAIMSLLHDLKNKGKTVFVVHHDLDAVRNEFDWIIMLNKRLIACGSVAEKLTPETLQQTFGKNII